MNGSSSTGSSRALVWALVMCCAAVSAAQQGDTPETTVTGEAVEVRLAALEMHGIGPTGGPLLELSPADFEVEVAGNEVVVDAIEFASSQPAGDEPGKLLAPLPDPPPPKLLVFLVQSDLNPRRLVGHRNFMGSAEVLLEALGPDDTAAVFAFGSRLDLEIDITADRAEIASALRRGARLERRGDRPDPSGPLSRRLDPHAASRVVSPEQALEQVGLSLVDRDEDLVVIMVGWGLGRFGREGVRMNPSWPAAQAALKRVDAPLITVDISDFDYHSLEVGLQEGARVTGGAYLRAKDFPESVARRLATSLRTTVRIWIRIPADTPEDAAVEVRLRQRAGTLLTAPTRLSS